MTTTTEPLRYSGAKRRIYLNSIGLTYYVDPGPARTHLRNLFNRGAGWNELRAATGCSRCTIYEIVEGHRTRILRDVSQRILAVKLTDVLTPARRVPALGSTRRVRALYAAGHQSIRIAELACLDKSVIKDLASAVPDVVQFATAEAVGRAYQALKDSTGPSTRNINRAKREGWRRPEEWHPDDLDAPDPEPEPELIDQIALQRVLNGKSAELTRAEQMEAARLMTERGDSAEQIGAQLGVSGRTIVRWRTANGWTKAVA